MNVLILTPDAVGSTLLQRLITIYMQFHKYDKPVINLHELTNGLTKYHNTSFNQEILGKKDGKWGYYQTLEEIVQLLDSANHYKTSRLAHYHIKNRQDTLAQQIPFYQYLNENFYIISCRRHNVFEHALSWALSKITKKLNVYTPEEKVDNFLDLYKDGVEIDPNSLLYTLEAYQDYINWCNNHFNIANYFYYDEHLPKIENYVLGLPIFPQQASRITWQDNFDVDFQTWNQCRYLTSDLGAVALNAPEKIGELSYNCVDNSYSQEITFLAAYNRVSSPGWPKINSVDEYQRLPSWIHDEVEKKHQVSPPPVKKYEIVKQSLVGLLPAEHQHFIEQNQSLYRQSLMTIDNMVHSGVMISPPPIKKQTLAEKKHIIKNYSYLLNIYNQWISDHPEIGQPVDESTLDQFSQAELAQWQPREQLTQLTVEQKSG